MSSRHAGTWSLVVRMVSKVDGDMRIPVRGETGSRLGQNRKAACLNLSSTRSRNLWTIIPAKQDQKKEGHQGVGRKERERGENPGSCREN